jgi:hypothetical protein
LRLNRLPAVFDADAVFCANVDSVKPASSTKHVLSGINIHDGKAAAKRLVHSRRPHDPAHRKSLVAYGRVEKNLAIHFNATAGSKFPADHQRVGLGKKNKGIIDDRVVCFIHRVVAQAAVACHIDAEDKHRAFAGQTAVYGRFDNRHGNTHFRHCLNAFQNGLFESELTGCHLQLSRTRDLIDGVAECSLDGSIHGIHGHVDRNAKNDAGDCQGPPKDMTFEIGPAEQPEESHFRRSSTMWPSRSLSTRWH